MPSLQTITPSFFFNTTNARLNSIPSPRERRKSTITLNTVNSDLRCKAKQQDCRSRPDTCVSIFVCEENQRRSGLEAPCHPPYQSTPLPTSTNWTRLRTAFEGSHGKHERGRERKKKRVQGHVPKIVGRRCCCMK